MLLLILLLVLLFESAAHVTKNITINIKRVSECINVGAKHISLDYPVDAEDHYQYLLKKTAKFRNIHVQVDNNPLNESFIEKLFIDRFISKPVSSFGGMIPIMVQWSDYQLSHRHLSTFDDEYAMFHEILKYLRPEVLYVVVSQANKGIKMFANLPNVLVLSAGGVGHVPIPLIKGQLTHSRLNPTSHNYTTLGFYGSVGHGPRKGLIKQLQHVIREQTRGRSSGSSSSGQLINSLVISSGPDWVDDMRGTLFNLAPVGFGRGSFRLSEVVRLGRIPVYLYQDYPWLPYEGTDVSPAALGLLSRGGLDRMTSLYREMTRLLGSTELIEKYLERVSGAHWLYTNEGLLSQMELFFADPFSAGYLRCSQRYRKYREVQEKSTLGRLMGLFSNQ